MIIVGKAANNFHLGIEDDSIPNEFVCMTKEETDNITKKLKLKKEDICHNNFASDTYLSNGHYYTIHNVERMAAFNTITKHIFVDPYRTKVAPLSLVYAWARTRARFQSKDVSTWEQYITMYNYLYQNRFKELSKEFHKKSEAWSNHLVFFGAMGYRQEFNAYEFKEYGIFTEESLFALMSKNGVNSSFITCLLSISKGGTMLSKTMFSHSSASFKLEVVMERLYVDLANEFLLDEIVYKEIHKDETLTLFKKIIMRRCSQLEKPWFADYILENYSTIIKEFDPLVVDKLKDGIEWDMLTQVTNK